MSDETFQDKLERSSFGTPAAKAAMESVPQEKVDKVLARVEELRRESKSWTHILLPWSKPPLSMNDRAHYMAKSRTTAAVRSDVMKLARSVNLPRGLAYVTVQLHYRPRDNRRRDTDNLVATLKPICDALADGTTKHPGYGLVPDDTPQFMAKPEPIIHPAEKGQQGQLWLVVSWAVAS